MTAVLQFLESFDVVLIGLLALAAVYWADPIGGRDE